MREVASRVSACASLRDAFLLSGVAEASGFRWLAKGEKDSAAGTATVEAEFWEATEDAKARRRTALKLEILRAARGAGGKPGDWKAARELGALTDPSEFVPQIRIHVERQLDGVLDGLAEAFKNEPELYARALQAVIGRGAPAAQVSADPGLIEPEPVGAPGDTLTDPGPEA